MSAASWVLVIVLAILIGFFKLVQFFWRKTVKSFRRRKRKPAYEEIHVERFPEEAFPDYSISERDFAKIVYKIGYRHPRTEEVLVDGKQVTIQFKSQSGYSIYDAYIMFSLQ